MHRERRGGEDWWGGGGGKCEALEVLVLIVSYSLNWASPVAQTVKNLPAIQETWVQSLGWEDPLEKGIATHSSILAWRIPWIEEPGRLQSRSCKELDTTERLSIA